MICVAAPPDVAPLPRSGKTTAVVKDDRIHLDHLVELIEMDAGVLQQEALPWPLQLPTRMAWVLMRVARGLQRPR